jgi:hypothetical protein
MSGDPTRLAGFFEMNEAVAAAGAAGGRGHLDDRALAEGQDLVG